MRTYLHHALVRVQFAELLFDLVHALLHALLLPQQALLEEEEEKKKEKDKERFETRRDVVAKATR